jgi:hypothetical protein
MKKIFVLHLVFVVFGLRDGFSQIYTNGDWEFTLNTNNEATVTGYNGVGGEVAIPVDFDGFQVRQIGSGQYNTPVAFRQTNPVTSIIIPSGANNIADFAFDGTTNLTNITIPEGVTNIGYVAFRSSGLTSVYIPNSVARIAEHTFSHCAQMTNASLGSGLVVIDGPWPGFIFGDCKALTNISVHPSNTIYSSIGGVLFDKAGSKILRFPEAHSSTNYVVPSSVSTIAAGTFASAQRLTHIALPETTTAILEWGFGFSGLTCISLPASMSTIGKNAFVGCTNLTSVTFQGTPSSIGDNAFAGCESLTAVIFLDNAPTSVTTPVFSPDSTTTIYRLAGKSGWLESFAGRPTAMMGCLFTEEQFRDGSSGFTSGRSQGRQDVTTNPSAFNLFTAEQYSANYNSGVITGIGNVLSNPTSYNLYTSNSIMDLRMGGIMLQKQGSNAVVTFQPQTTTDLATQPFTNNGTPITNTIPMPGNKGFLRMWIRDSTPPPTPL